MKKTVKQFIKSLRQAQAPEPADLAAFKNKLAARVRSTDILITPKFTVFFSLPRVAAAFGVLLIILASAGGAAAHAALPGDSLYKFKITVLEPILSKLSVATGIQSQEKSVENKLRTRINEAVAVEKRGTPVSKESADYFSKVTASNASELKEIFEEKKTDESQREIEKIILEVEKTKEFLPPAVSASIVASLRAEPTLPRSPTTAEDATNIPTNNMGTSNTATSLPSSQPENGNHNGLAIPPDKAQNISIPARVRSDAVSSTRDKDMPEPPEPDKEIKSIETTDDGALGWGDLEIRPR